MSTREGSTLQGGERRVSRARSALDDEASRRSADEQTEPVPGSSTREEEERSLHARLGASRQAVQYCPYCAEETLFPLEKGWECRSCLRAFSVTFLGLRGREVLPS